MGEQRVHTASKLGLVEYYRDSEHAMGGYGNLVTIASLAPPTPEVARASQDVTLRVAREHPGGVGFLVVIDSRSGPPNEESRKAIQEYYGDLKHVVRAAVHIVEGEGFVSAAKRGALALIKFTVKPVFPTKIASTVDEGIVLMRRALGPVWLRTIEPHLLARELTHLRASLGPASHVVHR